MLSTLRAHKPSYRTVGIVASVPILAVAQGAYFLTNFRRNHGDAPHPVSPSRGIVIVSPQDGNRGEEEESHAGTNQLHMKNLHNKWLSTWKKVNIVNHKNNQRRRAKNDIQSDGNGVERAAAEEEDSDPSNPLRIFVVGDSLAAGVGSTKATPVLPEAIARSLSKALGGRPVHWTCHGTPGASTSRIMKDIQEFTSDDYNSLITDQQKEYKNKRNKDYDNSRDSGGESDREMLGVQWKELKEVILQHVKIIVQELRINNRLLRRRRNIEKNDQKNDNSASQENDVEKTNFNNRITVAISESRSKIDQKLHQIIQTLQHNIQRPFRRQFRQSNEDGDDDERAIWNQWNTNLSRSTILKPKDMAQYDVVIVLTGLNDLKGLFLPWMQEQDGSNNGTFKEDLRKVFYFLTGKKYQEQKSDKDDEKHLSMEQNSHRRIMKDKEDENRALVVLPALPTRVLPMFQYPPLCWIIHTLFDLIDEEKRALSKEYPGSLLFIEAPTIEMITEIEKGEYFLVTKRKTETVLLALKDVTMRVRSEIEGLMKKHIKKHDFKDNEKEIELHYEASKHHNLTDSMPAAVGSKLVSIDNIHPNDDGYDFWGRHIAEGIIEELKLKNKRC